MHAVVEEKPVASTTSLIVANLIAIVLALIEGWDLRELMLVYWSQSVIIGYYSFRRMMDLKTFSTKGVRMNDQKVDPTEKTKKSMAWFFVVHYGFFHLMYFLFIVVDPAEPFELNWFFFWVCVAAFFVNHGYSYRTHRDLDAERVPNIGTIMLFPYARIIPMHLTILAGGWITGASTFALLIFLGLKTAADVVMHKIEHSSWRALPGSS